MSGGRVARPGRSARYDDLILPRGVERISLGEGGTPLLAAGDVLLKCEHLNPTGSYKDRVAAVAMSIGAADGALGWVGTSSGNAGAAFAAYGARAGLPGRLFTVDGVVADKLAHVQAFATDVWEVAGFGRSPRVDAAVFDAVARFAEAEHLVVGITARSYNPAAMDGIREIAFELADELGDAPAAVYVPTGGGGLLASLGAGFAQARAEGLARRIPRLVAVQPEGCAPIHRAAQLGLDDVPPVAECLTDISGLQLPNPPDGALALHAVRESRGRTVAVPDERVHAAQRELAERHGVFVEPAAALAFAGYQAEPEADAVVLMTGNGLKTLLASDAPRRPRRLRLEDIPSLLSPTGSGHPQPSDGSPP